MSVKDIRRVLQQLNEPNEFQMEEVNLTDNTFFIYKVSNCKIKDMDIRFNDLRPDHTRFDVFINGQFILDVDYIFEQSGKDFLIKFKKFSSIAFFSNISASSHIRIGVLQIFEQW